MDDAPFMDVMGAAADGLLNGGAADSDDENDEAGDFGSGAISADRLSGGDVPVVGALSFEVESDERTARRASSQNAASFAMSEQSWSREQPYVKGCRGQDEAYVPVLDVDRTPAEEAEGATHRGCPVKHLVVVEWLQGSSKRATSLGEEAAQTPPVTVETMVTACDLASAGFTAQDVVVEPTVQEYCRLTIYVIMVYSWCTMLRPVNLLGLKCHDVMFAPNGGCQPDVFRDPRPTTVGAGGAMTGEPVSKGWWEQNLASFVLIFDPALSARGVGGLYGFRRGATQFWLNYTGDVDMVMRMGVWKSNSTRFLFYVLNYRCRGTLRARIRDCYRVDSADLATRVGGLVDEFMVWFEQRVVALQEANHGNFFVGAFGAEVAAKVLDMVNVLLRTHGGVGLIGGANGE
ncbi:hypothetical protein I4F81_012933 [Pyropia yezoensis]|uniref:Uncharacterized protein n=1 Tax=Pyropia yezoensis TaxID=2788 RepID=A0ABQ9T868_PYRYE|nr:hypothetical protein I4F81_012933 [Neopyropia yezoensis]